MVLDKASPGIILPSITIVSNNQNTQEIHKEKYAFSFDATEQKYSSDLFFQQDNTRVKVR